MKDDNFDPTDVSETLKDLGVADVAPKIYEDLLQPAAKELGGGLVVVARAVSMALAPVEGAVWGFSKIRNWLATKLTQKLAGRDQESIQPPAMNVAGPAILNLTFAGEIPSIRELYANLIASSMDVETAHSAHPSFVRIIEQLSSDEAKILDQFRNRVAGDSLCFEVTEESGYRVDDGSYISDQWNTICDEAGIEFAENKNAYMENLVRLRIISEIHENKSELIPEGGNDHGSWETHLYATTEKSLVLTELGEMFINACVDDD